MYKKIRKWVKKLFMNTYQAVIILGNKKEKKSLFLKKRHFGNERQRTKRQKIAKDKERRKTYKDNFNTAMKDEDSR